MQGKSFIRSLMLGIGIITLAIGAGRLSADSDKDELPAEELAISSLTHYLVEVGIEPELAGPMVRYDPARAIEMYAEKLIAHGRFIRGDSNSDGSVDLSDGIHLVESLFLGGESPACRKAVDVNGDGGVDLSDPVSLLSFLFLGGRAPEAPFPACGTDWSERELGCAANGACSNHEYEIRFCLQAFQQGASPYPPYPPTGTRADLYQRALAAAACMRSSATSN